MQTKNNPQKLIIHHSANASLSDQFSEVDLHHKARFGLVSSLGFFVGYHYFIERNGEVIQGRADTDEGAHCKGQNFVSIGICLAGHFNFNSPTPAQRNALVRLIDTLLNKYNFTHNEIFPHRAFRNTDCYGTMLGDEWAKITYLQYKKKDIVNSIWEFRELLAKYLYEKFKTKY